MTVHSVIAGNGASHAEEPPTERPGALVYKVQMENNEAAVAKIPSNHSRYAREVRWKLLNTLLLTQRGLGWLCYGMLEVTDFIVAACT